MKKNVVLFTVHSPSWVWKGFSCILSQASVTLWMRINTGNVTELLKILLFMTKVNQKTLASLNCISHRPLTILINNLSKKMQLEKAQQSQFVLSSMSTAVLLLQKRNMAHCHMSLQLWSKDFHTLWNTTDISIHSNLFAKYSFAPYFMSIQ